MGPELGFVPTAPLSSPPPPRSHVLLSPGLSFPSLPEFRPQLHALSPGPFRGDCSALKTRARPRSTARGRAGGGRELILQHTAAALRDQTLPVPGRGPPVPVTTPSTAPPELGWWRRYPQLPARPPSPLAPRRCWSWKGTVARSGWSPPAPPRQQEVLAAPAMPGPTRCTERPPPLPPLISARGRG